MPVSVKTGNGIPRDFVKSLEEDMLKAIKAGVVGAGEHAKTELRQKLAAFSPSGKLPNIFGVKVYPEGNRLAWAPSVSVFARGKSASRIMEQLQSGATITARGGKALAIPVHNQRRNGRLATPDEIGRDRMIYIPPKSGRNNGKYLGMLALPNDGATRMGGSRSRAGRTARGGVRREARGSGLVPMFILVRSVQGRKVFDEAEIVASAMRVMPGLIDRSFSMARSGK